MKEYIDVEGDGSITAYETGPDFISLRFSDGSQHRYTCKSAGTLNVERMKWLALTGNGLAKYMKTHAMERVERAP
jgi:hypothetical protein